MPHWKFLASVFILIRVFKDQLLRSDTTIGMFELDLQVSSLFLEVFGSESRDKTRILSIMENTCSHHCLINVMAIGVSPFFFMVSCVSHTSQDVSNQLH